MNDDNGLHAFVRQKAGSASQAEPEVDWEARRRKWLADIAQLYDLIKKWLAPLDKEGTVRYQTGQITLTEDYIGSYSVDVLTLLIGKQHVEFRPKGTLIVGADGRVDVRGQRAAQTIVLKGDQWSIVEQGPHLLKILPFNEESFQDVLREVME